MFLQMLRQMGLAALLSMLMQRLAFDGPLELISRARHGRRPELGDAARDSQVRAKPSQSAAE